MIFAGLGLNETKLRSRFEPSLDSAPDCGEDPECMIKEILSKATRSMPTPSLRAASANSVQ